MKYLNIKINDTQPHYINDFSLALLDGFYLKEGEDFNKALARTATAFCYGDYELAQRLYDAAFNGWFMFASPILSNAPKGMWKEKVPNKDWKNSTKNNKPISKDYWDGQVSKSMPISCFALVAPDSIVGQMDAGKEAAALSVAGGGVGIHNQIRAITSKAPGPIPYMKMLDATVGYYRQGETRRGAFAYYMDIDHPDIVEHIKFRLPSGGDSARKSDNRKQFHNAVNITDKFIDALLKDLDWDLKCPHSGEVRETLKARALWEEILETRALTGEPYIFKIDTANRALPKEQKDLGLKVNGSNICIEISLPTNEERTFVCCLSSLNLELYDEWKDTTLVEDLTRFLDNVIQYFIDNASDTVKKAKFSAYRERAIGIGTMGWAYYLQKNNIPFESGGFNSAIQHTHLIYKNIKEKALSESIRLAEERGESPDMIGSGRRNSHLLAIAPNSNNGIILNTSPSIEPISRNAYTHSTRAGSFLVKNKYLDKLLKEINSDSKWLEEQWNSIISHNGSVKHLEYLSDEQKEIFKTAFEIDQHWVIEQADARQQYICQSQSLNLFFPSGVDRTYFNSVHLKGLTAKYIKSMYYSRMERGVNADTVKEIERKAIKDWSNDECVACSG